MDGNRRISRTALRSGWVGVGDNSAVGLLLLLGLLQLSVRNFLAPPFCGLESRSHRSELLFQLFVLLRELQHVARPLLHPLDTAGMVCAGTWQRGTGLTASLDLCP